MGIKYILDFLTFRKVEALQNETIQKQDEIIQALEATVVDLKEVIKLNTYTHSNEVATLKSDIRSQEIDKQCHLNHIDLLKKVVSNYNEENL